MDIELVSQLLIFQRSALIEGHQQHIALPLIRQPIDERRVSAQKYVLGKIVLGRQRFVSGAYRNADHQVGDFHLLSATVADGYVPIHIGTGNRKGLAEFERSRQLP